uniref:Uncharacterized protein n=1 Tax=Arundo donax TaxID=35708 RepID=A0A0A9BAU5_ARUDO
MLITCDIDISFIKFLQNYCFGMCSFLVVHFSFDL